MSGGRLGEACGACSWTPWRRPDVATKLAALLERPDSAPGDKDRNEIIALLTLGIHTGDAVHVIQHASTRAPDEVTQLLAQAFEYLGDLALDRTQRRTLNQQAQHWHRHSAKYDHGGDPTESPTRRRPPQQPGRGDL